MSDVLAIGELNCDMIVSGLNSMPIIGREINAESMALVLGSSTAICASGMSALGLKTSFCSLVGDDSYGRLACEYLRKNGVDTTYCQTHDVLPTGLTISLSLDKDRALVTVLGTIEEFSLSYFDLDIMKSFKHIHIGSFFLQEKLRKDVLTIFKYAKENNITTSLDAGWDDSGIWNYGIMDVMPYTDIFFPNEEEAIKITGKATPEEAVKYLGAKYSVVKCGKKGAICYNNNEMYIHNGYTVTPVDTTGAGDSFNAGFIYGFLKGLSVNQCLAIGNACGAVCVQNIGGATNCATITNIEQLMKGR